MVVASRSKRMRLSWIRKSSGLDVAYAMYMLVLVEWNLVLSGLLENVYFQFQLGCFKNAF